MKLEHMRDGFSNYQAKFVIPHFLPYHAYIPHNIQTSSSR